MIKERFTEQENGTGRSDTEVDLVTQVLRTMPKKASWSPERLAGEVMAVWFGSLHTLSLPTTSAMIDLCTHPEYVESLKDEAEGPEWDGFFRTGHGLPRIDAFLMESTRLNLFEGSESTRCSASNFLLTERSTDTQTSTSRIRFLGRTEDPQRRLGVSTRPPYDA